MVFPESHLERILPPHFSHFFCECPSLLGQLNLRWGGHFRDFMQVVENVRKVGENSARDQWSCSDSFRIIALFFSFGDAVQRTLTSPPPHPFCMLMYMRDSRFLDAPGNLKPRHLYILYIYILYIYIYVYLYL